VLICRPRDAYKQQSLLTDRERAAGAGCAIVKQISSGFDQVRYRQEDQIRHQSNGVTGRPVLPGFLIVFLIELAHKFLENRAHRMVVDSSRAQVYVRVEEFVDQCAERVGLGQSGKLVAEFKVFNDVLDVRREAVQPIFKVGKQLLLAATGFHVAQGEPGRVVKRLAGGSAQGGALLGDAGFIEHLLGFEHRFLGRLQHRIHAAQNEHGQNNVRVFAALEQIAQHVIGDAPDKVGNPVKLARFHSHL